MMSEEARDKASASEWVLHNKQVHDVVADGYDNHHVEIYNPQEQARVKSMLQKALSSVETGAFPLRVLDFGSGTGNLSMHLLSLGAHVVAADVSEKSLQRLLSKANATTSIQTWVLNGIDLEGMPDDSFDMVSTYSVLHHVPDYLKAVNELVRVTKSGGVIYIDHEVNPSYWTYNKKYCAYLCEMGFEHARTHLGSLGIRNLRFYIVSIRVKVAAMIGNILNWGQSKETDIRPAVDEGDIHVTFEDHIEWELVEKAISDHCHILMKEDYLVCREGTIEAPAWRKWRNSCSDMRYILARKN